MSNTFKLSITDCAFVAFVILFTDFHSLFSFNFIDKMRVF